MNFFKKSNSKRFNSKIVGDTLPEYEYYLNELKEKVKEYNFENNIIFLGFKNDIKPAL